MSSPTRFPPPTEKQARILWLSVTALSVGILLGLLGVLLWGFGFVLNLLAPVLWPLAIAGVLSYLLDPAVDFFERKKIKRVWSILLVFFLMVLVLLGLLGSFVPRLVVEAGNLIDDVPRYSREIKLRVNKWLGESPWTAKLIGTPAGTNLQTAPLAGTNTVAETFPPATVSTNALASASSTNPVVVPPGMSSKQVWETEIGGKILAWLGEAAPLVGTWIWAQLSKVASWGACWSDYRSCPCSLFIFCSRNNGSNRPGPIICRSRNRNSKTKWSLSSSRSTII